jgi:hypothetical protein
MIEGGLGVSTGVATAFGTIAAGALVGADAGAIQGGVDYCFDKCGSSQFSWSDLGAHIGYGEATGLLAGTIGSGVMVGIGAGASAIGGSLSEDSACSLRRKLSCWGKAFVL